MKPWNCGQDAVLPDEVASRLVASGEAANPRPYPPPDVRPPEPRIEPRRAPRGYLTRKRA
jgi:hypothetical protein